MAKQDLRSLARKLAEDINEHLLRLGNVLVAISDASLYRHWGYKTWPDYLAEEIGMGDGAVYRIMTMSRWARTMDLTVPQRNRFGRLGRYKAIYVTKLCRSKAKVNFYLKMAETQTLKHLKAELAGKSVNDLPAAWGVWLDSPQRQSILEAIDLAYETSEFELTKGALLSKICEDYIKRWKKSRRGKTAMN